MDELEMRQRIEAIEGALERVQFQLHSMSAVFAILLLLIVWRVW